MEVIANVQKTKFMKGIEAGVPVFMGYFSISITFGLLANNLGIPVSLAILMSLTNFAGASQFIGIKLIALNVTIFEVVMTTFVVNIRHFLMSFCISKRLGSDVTMSQRALLGFGLTDENFVIASMEEDEEISPMFLLGSECISYIGWVSGTAVGAIISSYIPQSMSNSIGLALYVMFLGLIIPPMRQSRIITIVSLIAMLISSILTYTPVLSDISMGFRIVITIILTSTIGAILFPEEEEQAE